MRLIFSLILCFVFAGNSVSAQVEKDIDEGNYYYENGDYPAAEKAYKKALEKDANNKKAKFNLGNTLYRQGKYLEADSLYQELAKKTSNKKSIAENLHNSGNAKLQEALRLNKSQNPQDQQKAQKLFKESSESFKNALRNDPYSEGSRYNYEYARSFIKRDDQQKQDQNQNQNSSQQQQQNNNSQNQQQNQQSQDQNQQNQQNQQQNQNQQNQQQNPPQQQDPQDQQQNQEPPQSQQPQDQNQNNSGDQDQNQQPQNPSQQNNSNTKPRKPDADLDPNQKKAKNAFEQARRKEEETLKNIQRKKHPFHTSSNKDW